MQSSGSRVARASLGSELRLLVRRALGYLAILAVIAYLTSFVLVMAAQARVYPSARPLEALGPAFEGFRDYFLSHPDTYIWHRLEVPAWQVVSEIFLNSVGLLGVSLLIATVAGVLIGTLAAFIRSRAVSSLVMLLSVLGTSMPSFLLAMCFWVLNIMVHRTFDITVLPQVGFGWDNHLIMPALVLAMRPLAQIAQVTHVSLTEVLGQDFIRTAHAKGLSRRMVRNDHAYRNVLIPVLNTIGASLRFSLASLPVVEIFFYWPGVGSTLLGAQQRLSQFLFTDLILSLGAFFLVVNLAIEVFFPLIDPRLADDGERAADARSGLRDLWDQLRAWLGDLGRILRRERRPALPPLPAASGMEGDRPDHSAAHRAWYLRSFFSSPLLLIGLVMLGGLLILVFAGSRLTPSNPYEIHGVTYIDGVLSSPPYEPGEVFPWGTDQIGRDIQAMVLWGARQTISLAFFCMLARLAVGILIGALAGWRRGGWFDRLVQGAVGVWAAFPITLFAILLIFALGIQKGVWVFVVAFSLVGWGEIAQFVRGQVISIQAQPYIDAARSVGARGRQLLIRHVVPNLFNHLIVLGVFELGAVLMLLAELGFLGVSMGGGFSLEVGAAGAGNTSTVAFSDVPEWSSMIAVGRVFWRSSPWITWYPAGAFFLAIMTFNLLGDGLRSFLERSQANLSRMFNRYTLTAAVLVGLGLNWFLMSTNPLGVYTSEARSFDTAAAMADIQQLVTPDLAGRETGTPGNLAAAEYIAAQMDAAGLQPVLPTGSYIQPVQRWRLHLTETPTLTLLDDAGGSVTAFTYRKDFVELVASGSWGQVAGPLVALTFGPLPEDIGPGDRYGVGALGLQDSVVLVRAPDQYLIPDGTVAGLLVISDDPMIMLRRELYPDGYAMNMEGGVPAMFITPAVAESLLAASGSSLAEWDALRETLDAGEARALPAGPAVRMTVQPVAGEPAAVDYNVIGILPGTGAVSGLDSRIIVVSAHFDGLGLGPNGAFYPGANDNASGVAVLLEIARRLNDSPYEPKKTILFVAWSGGEHRQGLDVPALLTIRGGMENWVIEAVIDITGAGAGDGATVATGSRSDPLLAALFDSAATRLNIPVTPDVDPHGFYYTPSNTGGQDLPLLAISWEGPERLMHTPLDSFGIIDPEKIGAVGRTTYLTILVLSRETDY